MRPEVKSIYDRQVARCLGDIEEVKVKLPTVVAERIKRAIEYTAIDVDRMNKTTGDRDGCKKETTGNV